MKLLLCLMFMIPLATNCGSEQRVYKKPRQSAEPFKYQSTIDDKCNKCHTFQGELSDGAKARVTNGSMPPNGGLTEQEKKWLTD